MPVETSLPTIAVLGTGIIGAPVARNIARAGFPVRVWNRTPAKAKALEEDGVQAFRTPADAVRDADVILTVLKDGPSVQETIADAVEALKPGAVWLQLSTVGVEATDTLAGIAAHAGLVFYDAPVLGTRQPAEQGQLVIFGSGPVDVRAVVQPIFDAIGKKAIWIDDKPGASSRLKLALNAWVFVLTHGAAESLSIAQALGLDPALIMEAVAGGPLDCGYLQTKGKAMLAGDYATSFSVENGAKDAQLVLDALVGTDVRADLAAAGLERIAAGHGGKDIAASFLA
ncbi:NAD(P)-dependent oxidoreductase [Sphingomonas sp. CFBP 13720]|uniref:NAD(P)-dependent oxidoreductase n=1 Tax=Sphingomonas sp. CFBP 13720 TaxID=2775302 RepID=UPI00177B974D|nr:NAD(P)-dependent oxidoreductase [Sphingomonas sp. CFBP 13720]MBD8678909.1 NAD(P)-dependent oxidoreductase [Sphingomonas sp. CFBP 13720]